MAHLSLVSKDTAQERVHVEGQRHPIKLYLVVWGWLFVLSTCSYLVDYFGLQGYLRWFLILLFMVVKAGLIVAVFMHMAWERLALVYAILVPPGAVLLFVAIMAFESDYTHFTRLAFFETGGTQTANLGSQTARSEAGKPDLNAAKVEAELKGNKAALSGSATSLEQAEKIAPAGGADFICVTAVPRKLMPGAAECEAPAPDGSCLDETPTACWLQ
jgi:cytochrome c oxidase subunit IV